jgi:hypothetical protein
VRRVIASRTHRDILFWKRLSDEKKQNVPSKNGLRHPIFGQAVLKTEAGCCPKAGQAVVDPCGSKTKTVPSCPTEKRYSLEQPVIGHERRRSRAKSGRRDSNPRQPAWKAFCRTSAARFLSIGSRRALSNHHEIGSAPEAVFQLRDGAVCACGSTGTVYSLCVPLSTPRIHSGKMLPRAVHFTQKKMLPSEGYDADRRPDDRE